MSRTNLFKRCNHCLNIAIDELIIKIILNDRDFNTSLFTLRVFYQLNACAEWILFVHSTSTDKFTVQYCRILCLIPKSARHFYCNETNLK